MDKKKTFHASTEIHLQQMESIARSKQYRSDYYIVLPGRTQGGKR